MGKEIAAVMFEVILGENSVEVQVICQKKENRQKVWGRRRFLFGEGCDGGVQMSGVTTWYKKVMVNKDERSWWS